MSRTLAVILTLTLAFTGASFVVAPPSEADAQQARPRVHKKTKKVQKRTTKRVRRDHRHTRNHRPRHHHRSRVHHRHHTHGGVHIGVGSPYWVHRHHYHRHHFRPHVVHRDTQVIVVESDRPEPVWVMPPLDCPIRTDEVRSGSEQWCATPRGTRHGSYRRWYDDGVLAAQGEYEYDQKEGVWIEFHPNGAVRDHGQYAGGERIGTWTTWGADGQELVSVDY